MVFLKTLQNSQKNTCARVSFLILLLEATWFTSPQSDFLVKVNDQSKRGRHKDKIIAGTGRDTHNVFTDFNDRY